MSDTQSDRFTESVAGRLSSERARELWEPIAQEFDRDRGGPDAAIELLNADKQSLEERIQRLLSEFEGI